MVKSSIMAYIERVRIKNFKCYGDNFFDLKLNGGLNIIVGKNEEGKSTILEAIHLALTQSYRGKSIKQSISSYLFNTETVKRYLTELKNGKKSSPPEICIELWMCLDAETSPFMGNGNSENKNDAQGIRLEIKVPNDLLAEYQAYVQDVSKNINDLPIEYYVVEWESFSRNRLTHYTQTVRSILVDSSSYSYQNGSEIFVSQVVRDVLDQNDTVAVSQAFRTMKDGFARDPSIETINSKISGEMAEWNDQGINLAVDKGVVNDWRRFVAMHVGEIPFHGMGKGRQCVAKTKLGLMSTAGQNACIVLLEEPENHLTYAKMNNYLKMISNNCSGKQVVVVTHSSFVANKLGLKNLILLNNKKCARFDQLSNDTEKFFKKIPGYDTLRLLLCDKAILVEGDSDEMIVQKAYTMRMSKLPIEDGIDIISVGNSFMRYLDIAKLLDLPVAVVLDTDGKIDFIQTKYGEFANSPSISVFYSEYSDDIGYEYKGKKLNDWTLEPEIIRANSSETLDSIIGAIMGHSYDDVKDCALRYRIFMSENKTECALAFFETNISFNIPEYISNAITYVTEK